MRKKIISIILILLGLVALGLGIGSGTIWKPETSVTLKTGTLDKAVLVATNPGVVHQVNDAVKIQVTDPAGGKVALVTGRSRDVVGWIGTDAHWQITGATTWEALEADFVAAKSAPVDPEGDEDPAAEPQEPTQGEEAAEQESAVAGLVDSDMWLDVYEGEGSISIDVEKVPDSVVFLAASLEPGATTAPQVAFTWDREVATPLVLPGILVGALLIAVGALLLIDSLRRTPNWVELEEQTKTAEHSKLETKTRGTAITAPGGSADTDGARTGSQPASGLDLTESQNDIADAKSESEGTDFSKFAGAALATHTPAKPALAKPTEDSTIESDTSTNLGPVAGSSVATTEDSSAEADEAKPLEPTLDNSAFAPPVELAASDETSDVTSEGESAASQRLEVGAANATELATDLTKGSSETQAEASEDEEESPLTLNFDPVNAPVPAEPKRSWLSQLFGKKKADEVPAGLTPLPAGAVGSIQTAPEPAQEVTTGEPMGSAGSPAEPGHNSRVAPGTPSAHHAFAPAAGESTTPIEAQTPSQQAALEAFAAMDEPDVTTGALQAAGLTRRQLREMRERKEAAEQRNIPTTTGSLEFGAPVGAPQTGVSGYKTPDVAPLERPSWLPQGTDSTTASSWRAAWGVRKDTQDAPEDQAMAAQTESNIVADPSNADARASDGAAASPQTAGEQPAATPPVPGTRRALYGAYRAAAEVIANQDADEEQPK